jgi:hypothetical protein
METRIQTKYQANGTQIIKWTLLLFGHDLLPFDILQNNYATQTDSQVFIKELISLPRLVPWEGQQVCVNPGLMGGGDAMRCTRMIGFLPIPD